MCHDRFFPSSFPPFEYRPLLTECRALLIKPSQQMDSGCVIIEMSPLVSLLFFSQCIGLCLVDHRALFTEYRPLLTLLIKLPRSLTQECELRPLLTEYGPLVIEYRALLTEYWPLLTEYRPLLTEYRPLLTEYRPLLIHSRPLLKEYGSPLTEYRPLSTEFRPLLKESRPLLIEYVPFLTKPFQQVG